MIMTTVILSIALTSVFAFDFENNNTTSLETEIPFAAEADSGDTHNITMEAVAMPDGMYAYRMVSYDINGDDDLVGTQYSGKPSIPGPTIILTEGDNAVVTLMNSACENNFVDGPNFPVPILPTFSENSMIGIHVHGVHYDISDDATYSRMNMEESSGATCGEEITYEWVAAPGTEGAWPYHDHMFSINEVGAEELGLFGTIIINPANGKVNGLVDDGSGKVKKVDVDDIEKDFVLWMVSSEVLGRSIFYGNEIDYSTTQYDGETGIRESALWTNPNLVATDGKIYRFHVLGLGDDVHAFHLHGHRWTEDIHEKSTAEDVIDVKEIVPLQRHTFIVKASDNDAADTKHDGSEGWMYHCHITDHMKQGMSGMMHVLPEYEEDDIPIIGATFTLSDEPGLWMKTLDAGVADELDDILQTVFDAEGVETESFKANKGTGYPLGYVSDALGELIPAAKTDFSNSTGRSLAIINPGETVQFGMKDSQTKHTITTLIYPTAAKHLGGNGLLTAVDAVLEEETFHFDTQLGIRGSTLLYDRDGVPAGLDEPGLYVFVCKIHPYMFSAVIVDDPKTHLQLLGNPAYDFPLLDLSDDLTVLTRASDPVAFPSPDDYPTSFPATGVFPASDLATELLKTFYVITDPNNWRDYNESKWNVSLPPVLVTTNTENLVAGLVYSEGVTEFAIDALNLTNSTGHEIPVENILGLEVGVFNMDNDDDFTPAPGIGEVWVNTQFETTLNKNHDGTPSDKPGTITVVDASSWNVERKIALPEIDMNHPHNMWTDTKNEVIYQTQWFGNEMAVIDRESGELIKEVFTGQSPSHVMTSPDTGKIYIAVNGEESVNEFDPETLEMTRQLSTGFRSHPHGHWVSSSGDYIVTPDFLGLKASILNVETGEAKSSSNVLYGPIATGMKGDESVFYTADFLGNANTEIDTSTGTILSQINWLQEGADRELGLVGLPIQTPISPDDQYMVTALTLGGKVGVVDVSTSPATVTAILNCDPGCHGVQWGAKSGEGYYAYVSSKFSNSMIIVDPNPDNDVETDDAAVVGRITLADDNADSDDRIIGYDGFGGQGVLAIPNVYEGWIENTVSACEFDDCGDITTYVNQLSTSQKDPITP
jgi:FtsP/CotA-like multicopper oxidase with cupredoxin domain/DNA-binding beta-propeller fold protein YncE/plastocyanin